jgi:DNA-binding NarL/FixJ family response regulator
VTSPAPESEGRGEDAVLVYLVEDNRLLREGLAAMLEASGFSVVGAARNADEAVRDLGRVQPKVVLLEAGLDDSVAAVSRLREAAAAADVVLMNFLPNHDHLLGFVRAGVAGFVLKDATAEEIVATIRRVVSGAPALPRALGSLLLSHVASQSRRHEQREARGEARLTRREREVIDLIADGLSNKEIADRLHVANPTVKSHVHAILEKLGLRTRLEVAAYAHAPSGGRGTVRPAPVPGR